MSAQPDWLEALLEPQPEDSSDLRWALETAVALFVRGDRPQAMRWLQHAVATAKADGRSDRASALERAVNDLTNRPFPRPRSNPAMQVTHKSTQAMPAIEAQIMEPIAPTVAGSAKEPMRTAPYKIQPDDATHMGGPDSELLKACESSTPTPNLAAGEGPFTPPPPGRPRPPTLIRDGLDVTMTNVRRERPAPPSINRDQSERTMVMGADELPQPSVGPRSMPTHMPSTLGSHQTALEPMHAVRVVIESGSGRDIVLRLLDEGEGAPLGAQEALLIPLGVAKKPPLDPTQA